MARAPGFTGRCRARGGKRPLAELGAGAHAGRGQWWGAGPAGVARHAGADRGAGGPDADANPAGKTMHRLCAWFLACLERVSGKTPAEARGPAGAPHSAGRGQRCHVGARNAPPAKGSEVPPLSLAEEVRSHLGLEDSELCGEETEN